MIDSIAISTGGGDAPGLNAVIRAIVRSAIKEYGWEVYGIETGFDGLLETSGVRRLESKDVRGILQEGGTILGTTNRGNPFEYPAKVGSKIVKEDRSDELIANFKSLGLDALIAIGGDGTLCIAHELFKKGLPVVGVPKTIDNDLAATDVTFGFDTAVATATDALDKLHTTAESHHRLMVLEVMGRNAGWIALHSGVAGGADAIVIPEIPFELEIICDHLIARKRRGSRFSIVVAAEGAYPKGGEPFYMQKSGGKDGPAVRFGGIGMWLARQLGLCTGMEARAVVLGHLQRGGSPTTFDRFLSTRFGVGAVELVAKEKFGEMVCFKGRRVESVSLEEATANQNLVDPEGEIVRVAEKLGVTFGR
ncbi:MAG: ATP-dependent 6-phosphofructokinase [Candidatus Latescibacteria bacterium]|nr:ATP-dependent 6-phosphofructokinase [Candidatus Latescibacterota bacterium]NIM64535.1 ATP-dependent 6-phosphofructokinase [Candidatus Latescibacterota bacterium]NIO00688.1 ATP-dependent 6-phosphofructokinase [Candidatus Latescibacterota bacterium]NIO27091.1 ATP-dependent 6-phosphofructokinase [Candidatus Latescibacterota bacterium]NIO54615.1 ATP-dependent 6-phosphofructokinase [Candidatus Latescibacterota bacterium]